MRLFLLFSALAAFTSGCKSPGDPCTVRYRDGQRRDPCSNRCLDEPMNCPDDVHTNPGVCSAGRCETHEDCAEGWICLPYEQDESEAWCAPAHVCGE